MEVKVGIGGIGVCMAAEAVGDGGGSDAQLLRAREKRITSNSIVVVGFMAILDSSGSRVETVECAKPHDYPWDWVSSPGCSE
jgi:hypothetical protein